MHRTLPSALPVWVLAVVGAVLIGVFSPSTRYLTWLPVVFALCVLATFVIQLSLPVKKGLVTRMFASIGGAAVLLAIATGGLAAAAA